METTIDAAGRLVVPKAIRDRLGLRAGSRVILEERDGAVVIEPAPVPTRLVRRGNGLVLVADGPIPTLTQERVRDVLESIRP